MGYRDLARGIDLQSPLPEIALIQCASRGLDKRRGSGLKSGKHVVSLCITGIGQTQQFFKSPAQLDCLKPALCIAQRAITCGNDSCLNVLQQQRHARQCTLHFRKCALSMLAINAVLSIDRLRLGHFERSRGSDRIVCRSEDATASRNLLLSLDQAAPVSNRVWVLIRMLFTVQESIKRRTSRWLSA